MSRERYLSLDRAQERQRQKDLHGIYIPEELPNVAHNDCTPKDVSSVSQIYHRNYGGGGRNKNFECRALDVENMPSEFLDDLEEPSFCDLPTNSSFDEVMCLMATPPHASQPAPTASEKLDAFRTEIAEVVGLDNLRKRTAKHIGTPEERSSSVQIDQVRNRVTAAIAESASESSLCPYKISPLPEDIHAIPPPPKNPKDIVAIIRRAKAIARLKALEEAKNGTNPQKKGIKKGVRGATVPKRPMKQIPTARKPQLAKKDTQQRTGAKRKTKQSVQHPPDYVPDEWAAAILRTRKLAGLRTTNPKLLQQNKNQLQPMPKSPLRCPPYTKSPTFADIMERVSAIRSWTNVAKVASEKKKTMSTPITQDELDEFEILEQLYGAEVPEQSATVEQGATNLQSRINALQQQLLRTPPLIESLPEELDEFEALEQLYGAVPYDTCRDPEYIASDLQDRIDKLQQQFFQSPHSRDLTVVPSPGVALRRSRSNLAAPQTCPPNFNDVLHNIDVPEFDINDIPEFAFSAEALADAGFAVEDEVSLDDITIPELCGDNSIDELGLEDITSPNLCDLSTSDTVLIPDQDVIEKGERSKELGFLTSVVNAVVGSFRNIFSPPKAEDELNEKEGDLNLDSSLPNMFEITASSKPKTPPTELEADQKSLTPKRSIRIPPHPKDPKDYAAMVKRAQAIQKLAPESSIARFSHNKQKEKREIKSTISKRVPTQKKMLLLNKRNKKPKKFYPPGEYSPSDIKAVARARSLAGLKNVSVLLNPERAAKIAQRKAAQEAELAAIDALPPIEQMRKKMQRMRKVMGGLPRPSIDTLSTLEAIRASLPKHKRKWRPTNRPRADHRIKPSEKIFTRDFGRVLIPPEKTQKKKGWRELNVMSPIAEEQKQDEDFIQFSPLKPHEARLRLCYLKEQAARQAAQPIRDEADDGTAYQTQEDIRTPETLIYQFSPIQLQSPRCPRTEKTTSEKIVTKMGRHGGTETIREEVTETSTIENGEVRTSTRQVTTKTDEYGNVTCHVQEGKGLTGEEEAVPEYLDNIEPPYLFDTSIPPPNDPCIPTPAEIIDRIRWKVQQKLSVALPDITKSPESLSTALPDTIPLPEDLTDEDLYEIERPQFNTTPQKESPQVKTFSPTERDQRMYAWGEVPPITPPQTPMDPPPEFVKQIRPLPQLKSPERIICIPPHPKDPKDYKAMVKRAQAIQKFKKQDLAAKTDSKLLPAKGVRVPSSRWVKPPSDQKRAIQKRLVLKKRVPKVSPKIELQTMQDRVFECPSEPPLLPLKYREAVARARLLRGLVNKTAALNPEVSARESAKKAAQAKFDALPEFEKIKNRMEKLRKIPLGKLSFKPSADVLGTLAAIRANMPPLEEALRQSAHILPVPTQTTITTYPSLKTTQALMRARSRSVSTSPEKTTPESPEEEFEFMEGMSVSPDNCVPIHKSDEELEVRDISCLRPHTSLEQVQSASPEIYQFHSPLPSTDLSLSELESIKAEENIDLSLEAFEALEAEAKKLYEYETPRGSKRHLGRHLKYLFPSSPTTRMAVPQILSQSEIINLLTPSPSTDLLAPSMRMLREARFFENQEYSLEDEPITRPNITPKADAGTASICDDLMQDFRIPTENTVFETSQLMPETPPRNLQERYERIKKAQAKQTISPEYPEPITETPVTSAVNLTPIRLISPSGNVCTVSGQLEEQISLDYLPTEGDWLVNIDETSEGQIRAVKQFTDLPDMPLDEIEYEMEPSLTNISFEKPLSPPPRPLDIISRIRYDVQQQLTRDRAKNSSTISPKMMNMPEDLPDENLFELSEPSVPQTPTSPHIKHKSPRVSLPMAWGEERPLTPVSPVCAPHHIPTPIKEPTYYSLQDVIRRKIVTPEGPIVIPPHPKDPKDYAAMIRRAKAIYQFKKQIEDEKINRTLPKKVRVPGSRWQKAPTKKIDGKPKRKLMLRKREQKSAAENKKSVLNEKRKREYPAHPPPLSQEYRDAIARARLLHGLQNRTAALNPKLAAKITAKKAAEAAAAEAYNALPELEKIKVRMERLRRKPHYRRDIKPTMEQIAYLEALKQIGEYQNLSPTPLHQYTTSIRGSVRPGAKAMSQCLSVTPRLDSRQITDKETRELAELEEFEALEKVDAAPVHHISSQNIRLQQRIANLEQQLLESDEYTQGDLSLAEFEALEALEAPSDQCPTRPVTPLDMQKLILDLQKQLDTPPNIDPRKRYRQLLAERSPTEPIASPLKTPEIHYSPVVLLSSPYIEIPEKRAEKSTTQITKRGNNIIKEQVSETSEIVKGKLKHFTTYVTTTTDPQGNVTCQINESKRVTARDHTAEVESVENLSDIQEPSLLDITPLTPVERPRPRDIIDRVRRQIHESYRPEVPTAHLIELRTPPPMLPLPKEFPEEELLDYSCPVLEQTPHRSPVPVKSSSVESPDTSIPQMFVESALPSTADLPPVSPLRRRIHSPEGPIVIPHHPKDPTDYKAMVRRARKIEQYMQQQKRETQRTEEDKAAFAAILKKKERVPISRWTAPPPKKTRKRKKLVMKKRNDRKPDKLEQMEYSDVLKRPEQYAEEIALARRLAGLKNRTAALNPKVAAREAAKAEEAQAVKQAALITPPHSPIKDYATVLSIMKEMKEKGALVRRKPSLEAAAYLDALKVAMLGNHQKELSTTDVTENESPKTRYGRIMATRQVIPPIIEESPIRTPSHVDFAYSPVRFVSPRTDDDQTNSAEPIGLHELDAAALKSLNELDDLCQFEQPSYMDVSQYEANEDQYTPLTPPQTPPPSPSTIISRMRQQYERQKSATCRDYSTLIPVAEFPKELPQEELFELSAPSFAQSPMKSETPIRSPNVTLPYYFQESPLPAREITATQKSRSPRTLSGTTTGMMVEETNVNSPLRGAYPGIKVKIPQGHIKVPPHPKDPTDVAAMIRRAKIIQKLQAKEAADKAAAAKSARARVPISRRFPAKHPPKKENFMQNLVPKDKKGSTNAKSEKYRTQIEYPLETPKLPADYVSQVIKARRLADLRKSAPITISATVAPHSPNYENIMERFAALKALKQKLQPGLTTRELTHRQHLINRQQKQERNRILDKLKRQRQQQGFEFETIKTPPPVQERFEAIKRNIANEAPTPSVYPYSPIKTPEVIDIPHYQPLTLAPTPNVSENVCIPDLDDISMPFDDLDNYTIDTMDTEDLEFQIAEAANEAYTTRDEHTNIAEFETETDFDIAKRIEMLQCQLLESPNEASADQYASNMAARIEMLENQLLQASMEQQPSTNETHKEYSHRDMRFDEEYDEEYDQQNVLDQMMDDFEEMERECM